MFARLSGQGSEMVARVHHKRKVDWRRSQKIGRQQRIMTWQKPARPRGSDLNAEQWKRLPKQIRVRLVKVKAAGRDGKTKVMLLATSLLDAERYPVEAIAELYCQRWEIELRLRGLKTTMPMEVLRTKSPEMAHKEVSMFILAYNWLRRLMLQASQRHRVPLRRLSFKGAHQVLDTWAGRFCGGRLRAKQEAQRVEELLEQLAARVVPDRPGRQEPRAVKRRPKSYRFLTKPRGWFLEIRHRSSYRAPKTLLALLA